MGGASPSCAPEPHSSPLPALGPSESRPPPSAQRPPWPHPSALWSHCLSYPLFHVSSAHPPISQYSAQDPVSFCLHPCSYGFSSSLFHPHRPPHPPPTAPSPRPPFPLIPPALHPYPLGPQPRLPSVTVFAAGKVCSLVWGIALRTFALSPGGLCVGGSGQGPLPLGESVRCGVFGP